MDDFIQPLTVTAILLAYFIAFLVARRYWIALPHDSRLLAQLEKLVIRLKAAKSRIYLDKQENKKTSGGKEEIINVLLDNAGRLMRRTTEDDGCLVRLLGGNAVYLRGWRVYHELERQSIEVWTDDEVTDGIQVNRAILEKLSTPPTRSDQARALNERIDRMLPRNKDDQWTKVSIEARRKLLEDGLSIIYDARDNFYASLAEWQNKASWLVFVSLLLLGVLGTIGENPMLLAAGAIGGLAAKLRGVVYRSDQPIDYGVSWATLFLTPLVGALSGWAGVAIVLFSVKVGIMGALGDVTWAGADKMPEALGLAILFGFSASLFDKAVSKAQSTMESPDAPVVKQDSRSRFGAS